MVSLSRGAGHDFHLLITQVIIGKEAQCCWIAMSHVSPAAICSNCFVKRKESYASPGKQDHIQKVVLGVSDELFIYDVGLHAVEIWEQMWRVCLNVCAVWCADGVG